MRFYACASLVVVDNYSWKHGYAQHTHMRKEFSEIFAYANILLLRTISPLLLFPVASVFVELKKQGPPEPLGAPACFLLSHRPELGWSDPTPVPHGPRPVPGRVLKRASARYMRRSTR